MSTLPYSKDPELLVFDEFEFSTSRLELRRNGQPVRLQQQPLKVLAALLRRPGELVTREELRASIWEPGIHLDFDDSLNHAVKYLRDALGDKGGERRFIQTVPRRGYRFCAPVQNVRPPAVIPPTAPLAESLPAPAVSAETGRGRRWLRPHILGMAVLVAFVFAVAMWQSALARSAPQVISAVQLTHFGLAEAVVSDGAKLYVDQAKAGIHSIVVFPADGTGPPTPLVTPFHDVRLLDIAADRKRLLVAVSQVPARGFRLWEFPLDGGAPRKIGEIDSTSAKWSPDGKLIAIAGVAKGDVGGLYVSDATGTDTRRIASDPVYVESWSPDQRSVRFTRMNISGGLSMWETGVDGRDEHPIHPDPQIQFARWGEGQCCGHWTADGRYYLYEQASLRTTRIMAVRDHALLGTAAKPFEIYSASFQGSGIGSSLTSGPGNQLLVVGWNEQRELARYDADLGKFVPLFSAIQAREIAFTRDRHWMAYTSMPDLALWKMDLLTGARTRLTFGPGQMFGPAWSPDGTQIAVHVLFPGKPGKVEIVPAGGGTPQVLFANENSQEDSQSWSSNGRQILVGRVWLDAHGNAASSSYWIIDVNTHKATTVPRSDHLGAASWSPDGRFLAVQSEDFRKLMLFDFDHARWETVATASLIWRPLWSHDSRSLLYQDVRGGEEQPIFRLDIASRRSQKITTRAELLEPNLSHYDLVGITADDMPIVTAVRRNSDVYALKLNLP